ncbi:FtsX-like permease family protein [Actinomadura sp. DC4]|uniref:ABC transporter permease n=1 Tax=Actinomadura sp. DC4 TaxID=3055069 RepID=UPI0025B09ED0|nr:FtsX-like permease family protein [Actinomadura sp. DC4]MDN3359751.1 FtsX-like permease family protein [Actinomadura sp. DC4]
MHATIRWIRADLRTRPGQALLSVSVVAGVVTALILAITMLAGAMDPWKGVFARSNGAHVWVHTQAGTDLSALSTMDGVTGVSGPYQTAVATAVHEGQRAPLEVRAMGSELPEVGRPVIAKGHWLDTSRPDDIVLERALARVLRVGVGDTLNVRGLDARQHDLRVAGVADESDQGPYPAVTPGLVWVLPGTLTAIEPDTGSTELLIGLKLADPSASDFFVQHVVTVLGGDHVARVSTWHQVRASMEVDSRLLGLLLGMFGVVALVAAALAIGNATGGRILSLLQDIALLKALGFTPAQIRRMLLLEQTCLGVAGVIIGILAGSVLTVSSLSQRLFGSLTGTVAAPLSLSRLALIAVATVATVAVATLLPAWRGSTVSPTSTVTAEPPSGRLSRFARLALLVRLPPALVLGARDAFTRRLRAVITIGGLAIPMVMVTIALGCWSTLDNFENHPEQIGLAGALIARPVGQHDYEAATVISADRDVAAVYPEAQTDALLPGQTRTIQARALGTSQQPYPFPIHDGRMYARPGEAVAGQGLLDLLHVHVGDRVRLTISGVPVIVHIVGRTIEPSLSGEVLSFGMDTLEQSRATPVQSYRIVLRHGVSVDKVRARLLDESHDRLDIQAAQNPAQRLVIIRVVILGLLIVLALIGAANLLTAASVGLRDHLRDIVVLRAMGLTPRQVTTALVAGTSVLALIAVIAGIGGGLAMSTRLIDLQGRTSGIGAGIGRAPTAFELGLAALAALGLATLTAFILARKAISIDVREVSRF